MSDPLSLYPMLSEQGPTPEALVLELARAPLEKAAETNRLRRALIETRAIDIAACARDISTAILAGGRVLACGNGGSATSTADLVAELLHPGVGEPPVPALCLTADVAVVTAIGNDVSFDDIFTRQLQALGRHEDVFVAISTSGNSENLVRAARVARIMRMTTIGIAGHDGGRMRTEGAFDHLFTVSSSSVHRIQEVQTTLYHLITELVQRHLQEAA